MTPAKIRKIAGTAAKIVVGLLGLIWFRWTPQTGEGFVVWACLLFGLVIVALIVGILTASKHEGYWPNRSEDQLSADYRPPTDPQDKP